MKKMLLSVLLLLSCNSQAAVQRPVVLPYAHPLTARYQDGCLVQGYAAFIDPNTAVTASHLVANLDVTGRSPCSSPTTISYPYSAIPVAYNTIDGEAADTIDFDVSDTQAAVLRYYGPPQTPLGIGQLIDGPALLVLADWTYDVQIVGTRWVGPDMRPWWAGAPLIQGGMLVGVAGVPAPGGGTLERVQ